MEAVYYEVSGQAPWGNTLREACATYTNWSGREVHIQGIANGNVISESILMGTDKNHGTSFNYYAFRVASAIATLGILPLLAELFGRLLNCSLHQHTLRAEMLPPNTTYADIKKTPLNKSNPEPNGKITRNINGVEYKFEGKLKPPAAGKAFVPEHLDQGGSRLFLREPLDTNVPGFAALPIYSGGQESTLHMQFYVDGNIGGSDEMLYFKPFDGTRAEWMFDVASKHEDVTLKWILQKAYYLYFENEKCDEQRDAMKREFIALMQADDNAKYNELFIDQQSEFDDWLGE